MLMILRCCGWRKVHVLTYHVSLLVDHHPQVFEDVINDCDVSLKGQTDRCLVWEIVACRTAARDLAFMGTSNCLMANSRSWISFRSSSVMASAWACTWDSLQEDNQVIEHDTDNSRDDKRYKKWSYLTNGGTSPKLSSGWPPCWKEVETRVDPVLLCVCAGARWSWFLTDTLELARTLATNSLSLLAACRWICWKLFRAAEKSFNSRSFCIFLCLWKENRCEQMLQKTFPPVTSSTSSMHEYTQTLFFLF